LRTTRFIIHEAHYDTYTVYLYRLPVQPEHAWSLGGTPKLIVFDEPLSGLDAYLGIFPLMLTQIIRLEAALAHNLRLLFWVVLATVAMRAAFLALRRLLGDFEEEVEGYDGEFVLLGLS